MEEVTVEFEPGEVTFRVGDWIYQGDEPHARIEEIEFSVVMRHSDVRGHRIIIQHLDGLEQPMVAESYGYFIASNEDIHIESEGPDEDLV